MSTLNLREAIEAIAQYKQAPVVILLLGADDRTKKKVAKELAPHVVDYASTFRGLTTPIIESIIKYDHQSIIMIVPAEEAAKPEVYQRWIAKLRKDGATAIIGLSIATDDSNLENTTAIPDQSTPDPTEETTKSTATPDAIPEGFDLFLTVAYHAE